MESKRLKRAEIEDIPLDCWGEVLTLLSTFRDFLNTVLTVKGLYDYVKDIRPSCTIYVQFSFGSVPWETQKHVTNLAIVNRIESHISNEHCTVLRKTVCSSWNVLFERFGKWFPNLTRIEIDYFGERFCSIDDWTNRFKEKISLHFESISARTLTYSLKILKFTYPNSIVINEIFPKVEKVNISDGLLIWGGEEPLFSLTISKDSFPSCLIMIVENFEVFGILENEHLKDQLLDLELSGISKIFSKEKISFEVFKNLEHLNLGRCINSSDQISNLPNLKTIRHEVEDSVIEDLYDSFEFYIKPFLPNFLLDLPLLEELVFLGCFDPYHYDDDSDYSEYLKPFRKKRFIIFHQIFLKKLVVRISQKVEVMKTPNLSVLEISSLSSVISDVCDMKNLKRFECKTSYGTKILPNYEISNHTKLEEFICVSVLEEEFLDEYTSTEGIFFTFDRNPVLKKIFVRRVTKIVDCPSLESLYLRTNSTGKPIDYFSSEESFVVMKDLKIELEERRMSNDRKAQIKSIKSAMSSIVKETSQIKNLTVDFGGNFRNNNHDGPNDDGFVLQLEGEILRNVESFNLVFRGRNRIVNSPEHVCSNLQNLSVTSDSDLLLKSFSFLTKLSWEYVCSSSSHYCVHPETPTCSIIIENCPALSEIDLTMFCSNLLNESINVLKLSNLQKLNTLKIGKHFTGIRDLQVINSPIEELHVRIFSKCASHDRDKGNCTFDITENDFPNLKRIKFDTGISWRGFVDFNHTDFYQFYSDSLMKIGKLTACNSQSFEEIIMGDVGCERSNFVVSSADLDDDIPVLLDWKGRGASGRRMTRIEETLSEFLKRIWKKYLKSLQKTEMESEE